MSKPPTRTVPAVGRSRPTSILMVVVLPAPFGPRKANSSPVGICQRQVGHRQLAAEGAGHVVEFNHSDAQGRSVP